MVDVRYLLTDEVTGRAFAELPLTLDGPIEFRKNDVGQVEASMPCDHPAVTNANFTDGLCSVTVLRDDSAEASLLIADMDVDSDARSLRLTLVEASAYFAVRVVEVDKTFNAADRYTIASNIFTEITTKTSTSGDGTASPGLSINASLPRFSIAGGVTGFTMDLTGSGLARHSMKDYLDKLAEDPDQGIEWRMDYATGSSRESCNRTLTIGAPLGVTQPITLTEQMLTAWGHTYSPLRAATRAHVRGSGYTATRQNTGSITAGWPLLDQVLDRPDVSNHTHLGNVARELRRKAQPPVKMISLSYRPGLSLPFGWCGIGDKIPLNIDDTCDLLNISGLSLRVEGIEWLPEQAGQQESVNLLMNLPLDELGT